METNYDLLVNHPLRGFTEGRVVGNRKLESIGFINNSNCLVGNYL